ncbi:MAG: 4Fe-4S dicluster domain-containing protein [candidate division WOR-3 bacterium]
MDRSEKLRQRTRELLEKKEVVMVIGFGPPSDSGISPVLFATTPEEAENLTASTSCAQNLANYLLKVRDRGRVAVVARGCDARSITVLLQENQLKRENLHILGIGCEGVIENGRKSTACAVCRHPNPTIYDELIGEPVPAPEPDPEILKADQEFEQLSPDERWERLSAELDRCIRCYACRQVCPNCYCPVCFVDASMPQLLGRTHNLSDNMVYHIIRALHMAGRCVECGACHRACPVGIDLMRFNRRVAKTVRERFGCDAGTDLNQAPALTGFKPDDPQEFIQ